MRAFRHATVLGALLLAGGAAGAQTVALPGAPPAPKSYAECEAAGAQWDGLIRQVNARHEQCLKSQACKGPNRRSSAYKGPCSCEACHSLHDALHGYPKLRRMQGELCRQQVRAHLEQQKAWDEQLQRSKQAHKPAPASAGLGPSGHVAAPRPQPAMPDLNVRPPAYSEPDIGARILRQRAEERIRERERRQELLEGTVRALTARREDAAEEGAEAAGRALGTAAARALGIKSSVEYEEEAMAINREREYLDNIMRELDAGMRRDWEEMGK